MSVFKGSTSSSVNSTAADIASQIIGFSIANKSGGSVTASVGIFYGSSITYILYSKTVLNNDVYVYDGGDIIVPSNHQIYVNVSGSCDYYFSIKGID